MGNKKISVIIPLYNKEKTIIPTVQSVINQTYKNFEIIIINDGSTDDSLILVESINDSRISVFTVDNGGVSRARNHGVNKSNGDYIYFLDSDDSLKNSCFEVFIDLINKYPKEGVFISNFSVVSDLDDKLLANPYSFLEEKSLIDDPFKRIFKNEIFLRVGNVMLKRDVLESNLAFDESLRLYEDFDFFYNCIRNRNVAYTPEVTFFYQVSHSELSLRKTDLLTDWAYNVDFLGKCKYERLLILKTIYASIMKRLYQKDLSNFAVLLSKHVWIIHKIIYCKMLDVYWRNNK